MFLLADIKSTAGNQILSYDFPQCKMQYVNCGTLLAIYFVQSKFPRAAASGGSERDKTVTHPCRSRHFHDITFQFQRFAGFGCRKYVTTGPRITKAQEAAPLASDFKLPYCAVRHCCLHEKRTLDPDVAKRGIEVLWPAWKQTHY